MHARDIMTSPVFTVSKRATLEEAARLMIEHRVGALPVVNDTGEVAGIITESDYAVQERSVPFTLFRAPELFGRWLGHEGVEAMYRQARSVPVTEVMTREVITAREHTSVDDVVRLLLQRKVRHVVIVRDSAPVGIVSRRNLLQVMCDLVPPVPAAGNP